MSPRLTPTPLTSLRLSRHQISSHNLIPNTSLTHHPLLIYHAVFPPGSIIASSLESYLSSIPGGVRPAWRYTMYPTDHFHSTLHEVLAIASGAAKCSFGHLDNPGRVEQVLRKGDVVLIPAGVSHRLLEEVETPFEMVGCYPPGLEWDMCYGKEGERGKVEGIKRWAWLSTDPVYGQAGPAMREEGSV